MLIRTRFSVYEVDEDLRVRRLYGDNDPTERIEQDGEWKQAQRVVFTQYYGQKVFMFIWQPTGEKALTITSEVQYIEGTEEAVEYLISPEDLLRDVRSPNLDQ